MHLHSSYMVPYMIPWGNYNFLRSTNKIQSGTILLKNTLQQLEFLEEIFGFPYLFLKLSLTLPHKGKVLWWSYFRSFIKSTIFSQMWKFHQKTEFCQYSLENYNIPREFCRKPYMGHTNPSAWVMIFFYTKVTIFEKVEFDWKDNLITPPTTYHPTTTHPINIYGSCKSIWMGNDFFFYAKVSVFENLVKKNLIVARVLRINIWFSIPVPKVKFDPPPQGKSALVIIF